SEPSLRSLVDRSGRIRRYPHHAATETVSGRETLVRPVLVQAPAEILAARTAGESLVKVEISDSPDLDHRSSSCAASCGDSRSGNSGLARIEEVQSKAAGIRVESERIFGVGMGQSRGLRRTGSSPKGMVRLHRTSAHVLQPRSFYPSE